MIEKLQALANANSALIRRGRFVNVTFLIGVGDTAWLVSIHDGRVEKVVRGPFVMANWTFAMRAAESDWKEFWAARPKPGFHDLFALLRHRRLVLEGDLHAFMANLFYFKALLETLRGTAIP